MRNARNVHVLSNGAMWCVRQSGRIFSTHRTQRRAIAVGVRLARHCRVELVTHARAGHIRSKDTYGREGPGRDREH